MEIRRMKMRSLIHNPPAIYSRISFRCKKQIILWSAVIIRAFVIQQNLLISFALRIEVRPINHRKVVCLPPRRDKTRRVYEALQFNKGKTIPSPPSPRSTESIDGIGWHLEEKRPKPEGEPGRKTSMMNIFSREASKSMELNTSKQPLIKLLSDLD